ncbi:E3 ubiquitin ISG15 ligase TRIM25-like [Pelobates cultripes]|uniref:E3 ubiquitin ISG15 ligase TRIM25-like n=1 Tax=Pelobates cultripes TaxID=61616 RepID=A0AAD1R8H4_PELCU|nr:E3 ubiquitin ISG15 ligase TRIM25-like [Pelobates cultripes]
MTMMAAADLKDELTCSICLNIYTDPATLTCGHSYCQVCITRTWDNQEEMENSCPECRRRFREERENSCPECRRRFRVRPELERNLRLCNMAESLRSTYPEQEEVGISCTYCDSPVPAAKTCLHCEASLCNKHLNKHSKSAEHVLTEPTTSLGNRKCSAHKKVLEYYCSEDAACICVSCSLAGEHRGHQVETLNEASEKKKEKLRHILQKLTSKREEAEKRVQSLQGLRIEVEEKAAGVTEEVTALIRGIREQLEALEKRVLSEIWRQEEQVSLRVSDLIWQLEIKKEDLSRKMGHIEELCKMTDPLTVLQGRESDSADYCDTEEGDNEDSERDDNKVCAGGDLDVGLISVTLHSGLAGIGVNTASDMLLGVNTASDMLLDVNTAANDVTVSGDMKTVSWSEINQSRPETPERFQYNQVLSSRSFSSGRHYWEMESSESGRWMVGMAYRSIDRKGRQSWIGWNNKSWGLWRWDNNQYCVRHDSKSIRLPPLRPLSSRRLGIFLDYEAGRLSFYELCDPIRHLHTFTATFTEPLHAIFEAPDPRLCRSMGLGYTHISLAGCLVQMFSVYVTVTLKSVTLLLMALDRYIAICKPLLYHKIANKRKTLSLLVLGLLRNCIIAAVVVTLASKVKYCKSNIILNFVCEYIVLLSLGCGDMTKLQIVGLTLRTVVTASDLGILLVSYIKVLYTAMKIAAGNARQKALHTCFTHLLVAVLIYTFGLSTSIMYKVEKFISHDAQNLYSVVYFLLPATVNPIIYGLRVKEIKNLIKKSKMRSATLWSDNDTITQREKLPQADQKTKWFIRVDYPPAFTIQAVEAPQGQRARYSKQGVYPGRLLTPQAQKEAAEVLVYYSPLGNSRPYDHTGQMPEPEEMAEQSMMAAADLKDELTCSICLNIYTDPATLTCGHSYCQVCITRTWDNQEERENSCPECRRRFRVRPELERNLRMCNIAESFLYTYPEQEEVGISCTYCIHSSVPAAKTCLHCEASLCEAHLRVHSQSAEHVLTEPTTSLGNRKCSVHKEILKYYCSEDATCICVSCSLAGEHRGHQREKAERRVHSLQELEIKKEDLSRKMGHIEELCNMTDPLTVLQAQEYCDTEEGDNEDRERHVGDLDVILISETLHLGVAGIVTGVKRQLHVPGNISLGIEFASDLLLDVNTASNDVTLSDDMKTVSWSGIDQRRPGTRQRFQTDQVLSSRSFSSGRHYWEVEGSESGWRGVGMAYPSIGRKKYESWVGCNIKSWGLWRHNFNRYYVKHDLKEINLPHYQSSQRLGIFLDYEAGRLSFYELCDPIRHLHTFTTTFTEPLHAIFGVLCLTPGIDTLPRAFTDLTQSTTGVGGLDTAGHSMMASADLRDELTCSICLNIYTDPATLTCGHSYCRVCITRTWDNQEERENSCPECRRRFRVRPELERNLRMCNIAESFLSTYPEQEEVGISWNRKCSVHKENLKYYCSEDATCICVSCSLAGEHRGHQVETLNVASEKKKEKLRNILQKLTLKREEAEKRVQSLQELRIEVSEKAAGVTEEVTALIRGIREQLEALEKRVLSEISRQEKQVSLRVSDLIRQLEIKKEDLSRKMGHIEELCNMTDPLTVLQSREYCDTEEGDNEDRERHVGDLDVILISETLHLGVAGIVTGVKRQLYVPGNISLGIEFASDLLLDVNTASNDVTLSDDMKTVSWSGIDQRRPGTRQRFQTDQVLSSRSFSSGRHYWEVEGSESGWRGVGMAYPSIGRKKYESWVGCNIKSWGLWRHNFNRYYVKHDLKEINLPHYQSSQRLGIFLDYEAGRLSFYELCDPIRHLHTFTATFTEPLHAIFSIWKVGGSCKVLRHTIGCMTFLDLRMFLSRLHPNAYLFHVRQVCTINHKDTIDFTACMRNCV